ncbi:MAG: rRNA maturation RNase YbeY [Anaerolineae bacterium]
MNQELVSRYRIDVRAEGDWTVDIQALRRAALATLVHQGIEPVEVAIVVSGDLSLRALNRRFRDVDAPTDVLAFPNVSRGPFVDATDRPRYLGDVIISYPRAEAQANRAGHSTSAELQLLVVHGMLHLLGYEDQAPEARVEMWSVQETILDALDVPVNLPD